ncbi:MAG: hypothetical protein GY759_23950 [Chloroflexi bacterium]|nr:hypothetical protein [Chloroflexota bacterium]
MKIKDWPLSIFSLQSLVFILPLICLILFATPTFAQEDPTITNDQCMLCHSDPDLTMVLPSNEVLPLTAESDTLAHSVHVAGAEEPLNCVDCHNDKTGYPHAPFPSNDYRSWQVQMSLVCGNCHEDQAVEQQDSMHSRYLAAGRIEAATCADCHGSHETDWADPEKGPVGRMAQVDACGSCHSTIADEYKESIHGQTLADGSDDVPTCSSCHPAHHIEDPQSAEFRLKSPELCGDCHADDAMMSHYEISTDVFDTYVSDFHGTTVQIFESIQPGEFTNKAVCSDCHGAHHILPATDENSSVMKANLTETCQRCHPDAGENFADSWMGHYRASWEHFPLVTAVEWFYRLVIPITIGFFVSYIGLDVARTWLDRSRQRKEYRRARRKEESPEQEASELEGGERNE